MTVLVINFDQSDDMDGLQPFTYLVVTSFPWWMLYNAFEQRQLGHDMFNQAAVCIIVYLTAIY